MLAFLLAAALTAHPAELGAAGAAGAEAAARPLVAARSKLKPKPKPRPHAKTPAQPEPSRDPAAGTTQAALPEPRALPSTYVAVAVLPLAGIDVAFDTVHEVEIALLREIDETEGMRSITPGDVRADDSAVALDPERCDGEVGCLARAGRYAGAHLALETRVAALGGTVSVSMRLIDTEGKKEIGRVAEPLSDDATQRATELHRYAVQLLAPDSYIGSLRVKCSQEKADVYLDDKLVGATPMLEPLKALRAGPHILHVTKPGFSDLYQFVDVVYNRSSTVELDLSTTTLVGVLVEAESQTGVGSLYVDAPEEGIEVRADGEPKGKTPLAGALAGIPAGKRRISLRKEGLEPLVREVSVEAGKRTDIVVERQGAGFTVASVDVSDESSALPRHGLAPAPLLAGGPGLLDRFAGGPFQPTWRSYGGLGSAGVGAVLLAVGGIAAWRVSDLQSQALSLVSHLQPLGNGLYSCADLSQTECDARAQKLRNVSSSASTAQTLESVGLIGGGLLVLAGGGLLGWDRLGHPGRASAAPAPATVLTFTPVAGGAAIGLSGQF